MDGGRFGSFTGCGEDGEWHEVSSLEEREVTYENLFAPYLRGAEKILIVDPYISLRYQFRNLSALLAIIAAQKDPADEIKVWLITKKTTGDFERADEQLQMLDQIIKNCARHEIRFIGKFDSNSHDRWIVTDTGWRIGLGRGLDIFKRPPDPLDFGQFKQELSRVKAFGIDYRRVDPETYFEELEKTEEISAD